jgi:hypothetical protein
MVFTSATIQQNWKQDFDSKKFIELRRLEKLKNQVPNLRNIRKLQEN